MIAKWGEFSIYLHVFAFLRFGFFSFFVKFEILGPKGGVKVHLFSIFGTPYFHKSVVEGYEKKETNRRTEEPAVRRTEERTVKKKFEPRLQDIQITV